MAFNFINVIDSEFKVYLIGYKKQFMKVKKKLSINTLIAIPAALVAIIITVCVAYLSHTHFKQTFLKGRRLTLADPPQNAVPSGLICLGCPLPVAEAHRLYASTPSGFYQYSIYG